MPKAQELLSTVPESEQVDAYMALIMAGGDAVTLSATPAPEPLPDSFLSQWQSSSDHERRQGAIFGTMASQLKLKSTVPALSLNQWTSKSFEGVRQVSSYASASSPSPSVVIVSPIDERSGRSSSVGGRIAPVPYRPHEASTPMGAMTRGKQAADDWAWPSHRHMGSSAAAAAAPEGGAFGLPPRESPSDALGGTARGQQRPFKSTSLDWLKQARERPPPSQPEVVHVDDAAADTDRGGHEMVVVDDADDDGDDIWSPNWARTFAARRAQREREAMEAIEKLKLADEEIRSARLGREDAKVRKWQADQERDRVEREVPPAPEPEPEVEVEVISSDSEVDSDHADEDDDAVLVPPPAAGPAVNIDFTPLTDEQLSVVDDLWDVDKDQDEVHCKVSSVYCALLFVATMLPHTHGF